MERRKRSWADGALQRQKSEDVEEGTWVPKVNPMMAHLESLKPEGTPDYDLLRVSKRTTRNKESTEAPRRAVRGEGRRLAEAARVRPDAAESAASEGRRR